MARRSRDGGVVSDLQQPFSQPSAASSPARGALLPRKKVTSIRITTASSIDGSRSKATSYKFDTPVSGGAYQVAREVTSEWNDIQKLGDCLKSEAECTKRIQALFSPLSFLLREKR